MNIWLILAGGVLMGIGSLLYLFAYGRFLATLHRLLIGHATGTILRRGRVYRPWMAWIGRRLGYDISGEAVDAGTEELKRSRPLRLGETIGLIGFAMQPVGFLLVIAGFFGFGSSG